MDSPIEQQLLQVQAAHTTMFARLLPYLVLKGALLADQSAEIAQGALDSLQASPAKGAVVDQAASLLADTVRVIRKLPRS